MTNSMNVYSQKISVIIICKNEERFVRNTVISVINAIKNFHKKEIIVVDSNSTDKTIAILSEYPITILQLKENWRHTPAAGRYIGSYFSSGDYLLFLDGDSTLCNGFLEKAIRCFLDFKYVGAIIGKRKEIAYENNYSENIISTIDDVNTIGEKNKYVDIARASAIIKKDVLNVSGTYNPWIYSEEEGELSQRIKKNGFNIFGISDDMVVHHTLPRNSVVSYKQRFKNNFHLGPGQVLRYCMKNKHISKDLLNTFRHHIIISLWQIIILVLLILSCIFQTLSLIIGWSAVSIIIFMYRCIKKNNIINTLKIVIIENIQGLSLIRGFFMTPLDPETYPKNVNIVKMHLEKQ